MNKIRENNIINFINISPNLIAVTILLYLLQCFFPLCNLKQILNHHDMLPLKTAVYLFKMGKFIYTSDFCLYIQNIFFILFA